MDLPEAILLDLDDTIIDDSNCVESCWADACASLTASMPGLDPVVLRHSVRAYADSWWTDTERFRRGRLDLRAATREIVTEVLRQIGYEDPEAASRLSNLYRDLRGERTWLFDGALETLEWLRSHGVRLGMMTNGAGASQRPKIERFGLAKYFDKIVIEGEFGCGKPDPRVYRSLLGSLRAPPEKTWAVGDNLEYDVLAPMELGIFGVWVNPAGPDAPDGKSPSRVISALRELMA